MNVNSTNSNFNLNSTVTNKGERMNRLVKRSVAAITALSLMVLGLTLAGCGGGGSGGVSSQVVSGNASVGAPLAGQVSLKDSSTPPQQRSTTIAGDGSFAIDVSGLKAPYVLQANGTAAGTTYKLHSFSEDSGTANVNPLSDVIVASAAGDSNPSDVFDKADSGKCNKIKNNMAQTVALFLTKLQPLLKMYNAENTNPITAHYIANHIGLDGMFDNVKISVSNGVLTIINAKTGAVIFTGSLTDIANGNFNAGGLPPTTSVPTAPTGLTAVGGTGQVTLSWSPVSNAMSYNLYYSTAASVTKVNGTKIAAATSPYVQSGLAAGTTYYYIVTAVNSAGESAASAVVSAATASTPPVPTVPVAPTGVSATGGTNQVTLSWAAVSGAASYNVYFATASGVTKANGTKITNVPSPAVLNSLAAATTYYYIVTAVNAVGEGAASVQVSATTLSTVPVPTVPAAPTGVTATGGSAQATVTWPAVTGATSYNIYYATTTGVTKTNGAKIANATSPYTQTGLTAGTTYYFIVTAVNSAGEGAASAQVSATTTAPVQTCGSCHAIPPASGQHSFHVNSMGISCLSCHGSGYSPTTVNAATHNNGTVNVVSNIGWNSATGTCASPGCHGGGRSW